ncbi:MAG: hypothetical protein P4L62_02175 [Candidatus Pacebacteria bacterium]|nr:hypothetical protein [Candidatus Paceibacterota bacterium]MDR3583143.1 hypothetical protein [Candidatus Paceibacterota bacterium]
MKKITDKKILLAILGIFLLAVFWRFATLLSFPDSGVAFKKDNLVKVHPGETITQKFIAGQKGMAKVEMLLRGPGLQYQNGDEMKMFLADQNCENKLRSGNLKPSFLASNNLYEFNFARLPDSAGKTYCLKAAFTSKKSNAKSLQVFTTNDTSAPYFLNNVTLNLEYKNQPLSLRPVYGNSNMLQDFNQLNQRISQYKPWFLKHYFLWAVLILFLALSLALAVSLILL